ncbi:MAG: zinc ribbon domain-containing protein [Clostridiales bacterium]|nr:zinc ribbon domain-containing protein [Clostridiales bacterium]
MYCTNCGNEVSDKADVCIKCGCAIKKAPQTGPKEDDAPNIGYALLGFFFPVVGLVLFLIWHDDYPLRAKSAGKGALISAILMACFIIFYVVIMAIWMIAVATSAAKGASAFLSLLTCF